MKEQFKVIGNPSFIEKDVFDSIQSLKHSIPILSCEEHHLKILMDLRCMDKTHCNFYCTLDCMKHDLLLDALLHEGASFGFAEAILNEMVDVVGELQVPGAGSTSRFAYTSEDFPYHLQNSSRDLGVQCLGQDRDVF